MNKSSAMHKIYHFIFVIFISISIEEVQGQAKSIGEAVLEGYTQTTIRKGTEVQMKFQSNVSLDQFDAGNYVYFLVYLPVVSEDGIIVIPTGSVGTGRIKKVRKPGIFGKAAYWEIEPISVRTKGNHTLDLAAKDNVNFVKKGTNNTPIAVSLTVGAGLAGGALMAAGDDQKKFEPAGVSFGLAGLLYKGSGKEINSGETILAEIKFDTTIKFVE